MGENMKKTIKPLVLAIFMFSFIACNKSGIYKDIPTEYHAKIEEALKKAGSNSEELKKALSEIPSEQKEAMAFLISYMPERDLQSLKADFLIENVTYAYKAKEKFSWGNDLPKDIFFNEVLPYCSMNETRDNWRKDFFERFSKYVENAKDIFEAIEAVNANIRDEVLVEYNTEREKPDQSPYESMRQNMASCSGLAILLTDAFRSVCIPSRIAGTPNWYDKRGNHNWTEVWADGTWYFTEYHPTGLNKCWFLSSAGKADENSQEHSIYATSFKTTDIYFPLVWDTTIKYVYAENVTKNYIDVYKKEQDMKLAESDNYINVKVKYIDTTLKQQDKRVAINVDVFDAAGQVDGGRTSDTKKDLNDFLTFVLKKNHKYTFKYFLPDGKSKEYNLQTKNEEILVELK